MSTQDTRTDRVVVGIDGSEDSRRALRWAAHLARGLQLPLHAVQAWQYPGDAILSIGPIELPPASVTDARLEAELRQLLGQELGDAAGNVSTEVARGPGAGVLGQVAARGARMLVVGSRGLGGFRGLLLGSVSRQLVAHTSCPVTVIGAGTVGDPLPLETILVGVDGSADAERARDLAASLATSLDAQLLVAHALPVVDRGQRAPGEPRHHLDAARDLVGQWCEPLREAGVRHRSLVVEGDARTALLEVARDHEAGLLVVGTRGLGPVAKLLVGSVASTLVEHGELPVTVVPAPG